MGGIPPFYCNFHGEILKISVIINFRGTLFSDNRRSRLSKFSHKTRTSHLVFPRGLVKLPWMPIPCSLRICFTLMSSNFTSAWGYIPKPSENGNLRGPPKRGTAHSEKGLVCFGLEINHQQPRLRHPRPQRTTPNEYPGVGFSYLPK